MALFVYVDVTRVWTEGKRQSAVRRGFATSLHDAKTRRIMDSNWEGDLAALHEVICPTGQSIARSSLFGAHPPSGLEGFEVAVFEERPSDDASDDEKILEAAIITQIIEDSYEFMTAGDRVVLVSGDSHYLPAVASLRKRGIPTTVVFWERGTARGLVAAADAFVDLNEHFDRIALR